MTTPANPPATPANPNPGAPANPPAPAPIADRPPAPIGDQPPAPAPPPPPAQPFAVFQTNEAFNERVSRETRKQLRELGVEDPGKLKEILTRNQELEAEAEKQRQAQMTELEREREQRAQYERQANAAAARAAEAERKAELYDVFAEKGVRNFDYAYFELTRRLSKVAEGETFDPGSYVDELLGDQVKRAALMGADPAAPAAPARGVTTTPTGRETPAPPAGGGAVPPADAFEMSRDAFQSDLEKRFGFRP